ncbi:IclR family transcriptional regulator C-terminal domain-containing protein [Phaeobacter sp. CAU 1743]|uniref:IclR family transcriptional regulator domain-containing protein n=1 Tax=Phaeobacter sp. CAU 1743 TaxID=3140367 RepID=UPI00325C03AD
MTIAGDSDTASPYKEIRAVTRALNLLEAAGDLGWAKVGELATFTGIDRATLYRLIHTLELKGYLMRRAEDGSVSLTERVHQLSDGVRYEDVATQIMSQKLQELTEQVIWPSDFATLVSGQMVIQASSHKYSPVSVHRRLVGKTRSVLRSALGLAYLSSLGRSDLARTLDVLHRIGTLDGQDLAILGNIDGRLDEIHRRGYALSVGLIEENISAIALPVKLGRKSIGAVNIAFFRTAMSPAEAAATCLQPLRECIARSEAALKAQTRY